MEGRGRRVERHRLSGEGQTDRDGGRFGVAHLQGPENHLIHLRHASTVAAGRPVAYPGAMQHPIASTPAFLDGERPPVPDIVIPRGVVPFHLPGRPVRGRLVRLGPLAEALLTRHSQPPAVTRLLGQAMALAAALASALKFKGSFSLQAKGDGPLTMLLADCTDTGALRGHARTDAERLTALLDAEPAPSAAALLGNGYLAFTVDPGAGGERHQGIVSIEGPGLTDMALHYFSTSEQLRCAIHLACEQRPEGWRAGALILERVAVEGGVEEADQAPLDDEAMEEAWQTATILASTVRAEELLDEALPADRLLYRLFHTEGVAVQLPRALAYGCRCSRQRLSGILEGFGADDLDHMAIDGDIVMTCEFCNLDFRFPRGEVRGLERPQ